MHIVGIDVGASTTKARTGSRHVTFPSVVAPYEPIAQDLGAIDNPLSFAFTNPLHKGEYNIGELALLNRMVVSTVTNDSRTAEGADVVALYLAAIHSLYPDEPTVEASIVAGLPERLCTKENGESLKANLSGVYRLTPRLNGYQPQTIWVSVLDVYSQPKGTVLDVLTDDLGFINAHTADKKLTSGKIAVMDVGAETFDLAYLDNLNFMPSRSGSLDIGMRQAEQNIILDIEHRYGVRGLNHFSLYKNICTGHVTVMGKDESIQESVVQRLEEVAERIIKFTLDRAGNLRELNVLLVTGGGGGLLYPFIQKQFPHAILVHDPLLANARGFYKRGLRLTRR